MSGGEFYYLQFRIAECADEVMKQIEKHKYGDEDIVKYTEQTLERFKECSDTLEKAGKMLQRVDWLVSCDDGEESFNERWEEDGLG